MSFFNKFWHFSKTTVLLLLVIVGRASFAKECTLFLTDTNEAGLDETSLTQNFIAYLHRLFDLGLIKTNYLRELILNIEKKAPLSNPFQSIATQSAQHVHRDLFAQYVDQSKLDISALEKWARNFLKTVDRTNTGRTQTTEETIPMFKKQKFERIKAGTFTIIQDGEEISTTLTHDFEVMNIPVTERLWFEVMDDLVEVEDKARNQKDSIMVITGRGETKRMYPDYPVTEVTWWSAAAFANKFSEMMGVPTSYSYKENLIWNPGLQSKGGRWMPSSAKDVQFKINGFNIYETEGFRLPTVAEQLFLLTNRGRSKGPYFDNLTAEQMHQYANFGKPLTNSPGPIARHSFMAFLEPVAHFKPFNIDGAMLFDLYGNTLEYSADCVDFLPYKGGVDPSSPLPKQGKGEWIGAWGGNANSDNEKLRCSYGTRRRIEGDNFTSFRLVRTLKHKQ